MGEFYDEKKIKAMEDAASKAAPKNPDPTPGNAAPNAPNKPGGGHFYDEAKIRAMEGAGGPSRASNLGTYGLIAIIVVVVCGVLFWKFTHNPDTMVVNINTAGATEIAYLPGIGEAKAKVIIDHRPYHSIDDLKKVPGIGEKTFEKMKPRVKVE